MVTPEIDRLRAFIRPVPDFPKRGILFRDITPLLLDPKAFGVAIDSLVKRYEGAGIDKIVGIEARGFIPGAVLASRLGAGFVPVRKPGKLPAGTIREGYTLEYGQDALEIHKDAISAGETVLIVDDLLATGGTAAATSRLVGRLGGKIRELVFLIELSFLNGRRELGGHPVHSLLIYQDEVS